MPFNPTIAWHNAIGDVKSILPNNSYRRTKLLTRKEGVGLCPLDPHRRAAGVKNAARHKDSCAAQRF
jgi:hypothetical protein